MKRGERKSLLWAGYTLGVLLLAAAPALAAEYPRRIAIAPFTNITGQEEIKGIVSILPRLLSSRLMAVAGAEVTLLPPPRGEKTPVDQAKEAKVPLLLQGTVAKLGKGYSIDTTVTDLSTGEVAGAFFTAAVTEDEIIPKLGDLAGGIAEKMFGVKMAVAAAPPPQSPSASPPSPPPPPAVVALPSSPTAGVVPPPEAKTPETKAEPATPPGLDKAWVPSSLKKITQSDKIADEVYGVVAGDRDAEGSDEIIAYGKYTLYLYRVKGNEILPFTRVSRSLQNHFLGVDAIDIDGDGRKEILVTNLVEEKVESFVLKKKGDVYEEAAGKIPYFLVVLPDWMGKKVVVGQAQGISEPFFGKIMALRWDGKGFVPGEPLPHSTNILPLSSGAPGLSAARFGKEWRLIYTDAESRLRILDSDGKSQYKSRGLYGSSPDYFEWGPILQLEGRRKQFPLRKAVRVAPGGGETPLILAQEVKKGFFDVTMGSYDTTRLILLQWDGGEWMEKAGTQSSSHFITGADFLSLSGFRKGDRIVASVIEQMGGFYKEKISRLLLFQAE